MRTSILFIAMVLLLTPAQADEFYLTDAAGKKMGPFKFAEGETLSIAGREYVVSKILTNEQKIIEKMKAIIVPEIDFRQTNIRDALNFLLYASEEFDPSQSRQRSTRTSLNLVMQSTELIGASDTDKVDSFTEPPLEHKKESVTSLITFTAQRISLYDAMSIICKISDLQWSVQNSVVLIEPKRTKTNDQDVQQQPAP